MTIIEKWHLHRVSQRLALHHLQTETIFTASFEVEAVKFLAVFPHV